VKYDIVFADKMYQFAFFVFPVFFPVFG